MIFYETHPVVSAIAKEFISVFENCGMVKLGIMASGKLYNIRREVNCLSDRLEYNYEISDDGGYIPIEIKYIIFYANPNREFIAVDFLHSNIGLLLDIVNEMQENLAENTAEMQIREAIGNEEYEKWAAKASDEEFDRLSGGRATDG